MPELTRIDRRRDPDLDVLFFGSLNPRRIAVIESLRAAGLRAEAVFGVYGEPRDDLIARAEAILNVHYYEAKVLEMVRLSYLLANAAASCRRSAPTAKKMTRWPKASSSRGTTTWWARAGARGRPALRGRAARGSS